jgi:hypothetical protein
MRWAWLESGKEVWKSTRSILHLWQRTQRTDSPVARVPAWDGVPPNDCARQVMATTEISPDHALGTSASELVLGDVATAALDELFEKAQRPETEPISSY